MQHKLIECFKYELLLSRDLTLALTESLTDLGQDRNSLKRSPYSSYIENYENLLVQRVYITNTCFGRVKH